MGKGQKVDSNILYYVVPRQAYQENVPFFCGSLLLKPLSGVNTWAEGTLNHA